MNTDLIQQLAKELATQINKIVNIPIVSEEQEQAFFEMVVKMVLQLIFAQFPKSVESFTPGSRSSRLG